MSADNVRVLGLPHRSKLKVSTFFGDEWSVLPAQGYLDLARHREFTGETLRVFLTMVAMMDPGNAIKIRAVDVAEHLGITPSCVGRQIKKLVDSDVLRKREPYGWELLPRYGFKGDPDRFLRRAPDGELVLRSG